MLPALSGSQYAPVQQRDPEGDRDMPILAGCSKKLRPTKTWTIFAFLVPTGILLLFFLVSDATWTTRAHTIDGACSRPTLRKEWRSLEVREQQHFIRAVQCLMERPSVTGVEGFLYDDFAYAHVYEGAITHYAAAFLPWHRYFIHAYETALIEKCGYRGALPYWDWSLDSSDLAVSPIWHATNGFGGDGDVNMEPSVFFGRCITQGPFSGLTRQWKSKSGTDRHGFHVVHDPHCLSRGFEVGEKKRSLQARVTPDAVQILLDLANYDEFLEALEVKAHNSIPQFVRGDFFALTAPNDPVFYLHHTQVDRLWWIWQQRDVATRILQYNGSAENVRIYTNITHGEVSLQDKIYLGEWADSVAVMDVMSTESSLLCYRY